MGEIVNLATMRAAKIAGTTDPAKLALIVRILTINADRNNAAQRAKLAAAQRLLRAK